MSGIVFHQQQVVFPSHHCKCCSVPRIKGERVGFPYLQHGYAASCPKFVKLSPHAVVGGSGGAQYSEQWLDARKKQKREKIAGVDQDELLDPLLLADADSCFCEFRGVQIHHKIYDAESQSNNAELQSNNSSQSHTISRVAHNSSWKLGLPMILLHGFGASVYSWSRVMKPLTEVTGSKVLAFDRPAFGLTSRVDASTYLSTGTNDAKPLNPYSLAFSVLATLHFIDFLASEKIVLVGHSAGSLVAVDSYFEAPECIEALILIAPAIFAPNAAQKPAEQDKAGRENQTEGEISNSNMLAKPFIKIFEILLKFITYITQAIVQMTKGMTDMLNLMYKKTLSAILRSAFGVMLIRVIIDKFGRAAVRSAWHDPNQATEHVLNGYTKPLRAKGWDKALAEFTAATLANAQSESKSPLSKRLSEISCPVLIITGDNDRIVPSWNAKRLSQAIPGSCLEVIKNCGHLPHEEKVDEFVSIVYKFLHGAFGDQKEPSLQGAVV
ncbi:2-hydroxy-6-oxononadienedioate/2-hydroxy-6-oxononatrienedioate [Salix suchowensis]|nr:2-hydroxy-6-oxononadienedioate/2-hydroxy-6-oxononatrienedioate [Salix suchowensis]